MGNLVHTFSTPSYCVLYFSAFLDIKFLSFQNTSWIFLQEMDLYGDSDSENRDDLDESSQADSNNEETRTDTRRAIVTAFALEDETTITEVV